MDTKIAPSSSTLIAYITRDIDRAMGKMPSLDHGYVIISNFTEKNRHFVENDAVCLVDVGKILDTHALLEQEETHSFLKKNGITHVVVFKPTEYIERLCIKYGLTLLNPSAELASNIENKISQFEWLQELQKYLPETIICTGSTLPEKSLPIIVQYNRAHTGEGTLFVERVEQTNEIKKQFPDRPMRVSQFIDGHTYTVNCVAHSGGVLVGNISYQITGLAPYTDNQFATIGNDWGLSHKTLNMEQRTKIVEIAKTVGHKMRNESWKGLFGIDVIVEEKSGKVFLIEINARQPASTTYESQLQQTTSNRQQLAINDRRSAMTTFEAHLKALRGDNLKECSLISINDGAQVYDRRNGDAVQRFEQSVMLGYNNIKNLNELDQLGELEILKLTKEAEHVISSYQHLRVGQHTIATPYYNNRRAGVRGALRVLVGKGTPEEIEEEARMVAMREHIDLNTFSREQATAFLVDHNLGIDCSGLVYHILAEELKSLKGKNKKINFHFASQNPLRKLLARLRPAENVNVAVLADQKNSTIVSLENVCPGDIITIEDASNQYTRDHVLLITGVHTPLLDSKNLSDLTTGQAEGRKRFSKIQYIHSFRWSTDGLYHHGIKQGTIEITDPKKSLIEQRWIESGKKGEENETWKLASSAKCIEIRRI